MDYDRLRAGSSTSWPAQTAEKNPALGIEALTLAIDRRYPTGDKKRSSVLTIRPRRPGADLPAGSRWCDQARHGGTHSPASRGTRAIGCAARRAAKTTLLIDARGFAPEGDDCDATLAVRAFRLGWRHIVHYNSRGTRFHAAGFGPATDGLRIDCYDNPGDYLGSGMDGLEVYVHGNAQDQIGQITKRGKMVIYGDVGQTFLYGAKGGEIYVLGNAAGRPDDQRRGPPARGHQRHGPGLPGRVVHGRQSAARAAASPSSTACGSTISATSGALGNALSGQQPPLAGLGRGDLRPRSAPHAGRRAAQRRGLPAAGRRRLEDSFAPTWKRTSGCSASASIATC